MIEAQQLLRQSIPSTAWVVEGILPIGLNITSAIEKSGKSWQMLQISKCVSTGTPFLNRFTVKGRVFYLGLEDPLRRLQERMKLQNWSGQETVDFASIEDVPNVVSLLENQVDTLEQVIMSRGYKLVIFDTLSACFEGSQVSHSKVSVLFKALREIAQKTSCAIILVDHLNKQGKQTFGSIAKMTLADSIWQLNLIGDKVYSLDIKGKDVNSQSLTVEFTGNSWKLAEQSLTVSGATSKAKVYLDAVFNFDNAEVRISGPKGKDAHFTLKVTHQSKTWYSTKAQILEGNVPLSWLVQMAQSHRLLRRV